MPTFITRPETGGPHPVVIFYMDAPGIREELYDLCRRVATVGYYAMLPNLYYRNGGPSFATGDKRTVSESRAMFAQMEALSNAAIIEDTRALLDYAAADPDAADGPKGCIGYCMGGQFVATAGGTFADHFRAVISLHGVRMLTDQPDSPHKLFSRLQGEQYFAFAENDTWVPLEEVAAIRAELEKQNARALVEVHPGTEHGFVFPQRYCYHKQEAERSWERIFPLLQRQLKPA